MQKVAWWGKLVFVGVNIAIASYFANPFAGAGEFFGWLISLFVSVLVTGIVVAGALMLLALLLRGGCFLLGPLRPWLEKKAAEQEAKTRGPDADAFEGSFWEERGAIPVRATLELDYEDWEGNRTRRVVDVSQAGGSLLAGYCRLRRAFRTFRLDRIHRCVDVDTGEIVKNLPAHLRVKYEQTPDRALDRLAEEEHDTLCVLLFIGRADGRLMAKEKAIIREACRTFVADTRVTDAMIDRLFADLGAPTVEAFRAAVTALGSKTEAARKAIVRAAEEIVATQKGVHPAEREALDYLHSHLVPSISAG